jgi:hypothetical protein
MTRVTIRTQTTLSRTFDYIGAAKRSECDRAHGTNPHFLRVFLITDWAIWAVFQTIPRLSGDRTPRIEPAMNEESSGGLLPFNWLIFDTVADDQITEPGEYSEPRPSRLSKGTPRAQSEEARCRILAA